MKIKIIFVLTFLLSQISFSVIGFSEGGFAVVELFTSEGCSSCPAADQVLLDIKTRSEETGERIYPLGFHVSYWDYLGWKDRFSSDVFNARQREYAKLLSSSVYTPQMIVNGTAQFGGYRQDVANQTINSALLIPQNVELNLQLVRSENGIVQINYESSQTPSGAVLNIALVESQVKSVIQRGENRGKTLVHVNVVRGFQTQTLELNGTFQITFPQDLTPNNSSVVVFIQNEKDYTILAATKFNFTN